VATTWFSPVSQYLEFRLRTCNASSAVIHLATVPRQTGTTGYDITLTNTVSTVVRRSTSNSVSANTPGLIDCVRLNKYWITWTSSGVVTVGKGKLGTNPFIELNDVTGDLVKAASVSTLVGVGEWQIAEETGSCAYLLFTVIYYLLLQFFKPLFKNLLTDSCFLCMCLFIIGSMFL